MKSENKVEGFKYVYLKHSTTRSSIGTKPGYIGIITINKKSYKTGTKTSAKLAARSLDLMMINNNKPQINNTFKQL